MNSDKDTKVLSVIVPAYNAEKFIRDNLDSFCIDKIIDDVEVIVVNDGSEDSTADITEEYVKKYPRMFRLFNKKNGGHGSGINYGIKYARGRYFKVIDADDWVGREAFINLVEYLKCTDVDMVYSGFYWAYDDGGDKSSFEIKTEFKFPFKDVIYNIIYKFDDIAEKVYIKMHNICFKTSILVQNNIIIDENSYYVDTEYILYPIPYIDTISFLEDMVYYYRIGRKGQSISIEKMKKNEKNYDLVLNSLFGFYDNLCTYHGCSEAKKKYIASVVARVIAGKYKIMLSMDDIKKNEIIKFEKNLKKNHPDIYRKNINLAVKALRITKYSTYFLVRFLVRKIYANQ